MNTPTLAPLKDGGLIPSRIEDNQVIYQWTNIKRFKTWTIIYTMTEFPMKHDALKFLCPTTGIFEVHSTKLYIIKFEK